MPTNGQRGWNHDSPIVLAEHKDVLAEPGNVLGGTIRSYFSSSLTFFLESASTGTTAAIRFGSEGGVTIAEYGAFVVLSSRGLRRGHATRSEDVPKPRERRAMPRRRRLQRTIFSPPSDDLGGDRSHCAPGV